MAKGVIRGFDHVRVLVKDTGRALEFYVGVLGLEHVQATGVIEFDEIVPVTGAQPVSLVNTAATHRIRSRQLYRPLGAAADVGFNIFS